MRVRIAVSVLSVTAGWLALASWAGLTGASSGFLLPLLVAGALLVVVGAVVRGLLRTSLFTLVAQVVVLAVWVHRVGAHRWIPDGESLHLLATRLGMGIHTAQTSASPVLQRIGEFNLLLLLGGCALLLVIEQVSVTLRAPAMSGLFLLSAVALAASALIDPLPVWPLLGSAAAWLLAIAVQHNGGWSRSLTIPAALVAGGALLAGLVLPQAVAGQGQAVGTGGSQHGSGVGAQVVSNPILDLRRNLVQTADTALVTARTDAPQTGYLRMAVLDHLDLSGWRPSGAAPDQLRAVSGPLPADSGVTSADFQELHTWNLQISKSFDTDWLPTPTPLRSVVVPQGFRYDERTLAIAAPPDTTTSGLAYSLVAGSRPTWPDRLEEPGVVPQNIQTSMTALPSRLPPVFGRLARQVTRGATTPFQQAVMLQSWFRGPSFTYSLDPAPGNGIDTLVGFVTNDRVGYCVQFSTAMAVMARSLGIPARVAVGFRSPRQVGDELVYTAHEMHSWPELYFPHTGWLPFEPTPGEAGGAIPSYTSTALSGQPGGAIRPTPTAQPSQGRQSNQRLDHDRAAQRDSTHAVSSSGWLWPSAAVLVALLLLAGPRLSRGVRRRSRWTRAESPVGVAEAAWSEIRDGAVDAGLGWSEHLTVRGAAGRLADRVQPDAVGRDALGRIVSLVEVSRYARPTRLDAAEVARMRSDARDSVEVWEQQVRRTLDGRSALRAQWWPASQWHPAGDVKER